MTLPAPPPADIDVLGNGRLIMRVIQHSSSKEAKPTGGEIVKLSVIGLLVDEEMQNSMLGLRTFRIGDGDECDAFECVVRRMTPGETVALRSTPLAFNVDHSLCKARPFAVAEAIIKLTSVERPSVPVVETSMRMRLDEAKRKKSRGNFLFGRDEFDAAAFSFSLGLSYIIEACKKQLAARVERAGTIVSEFDSDDQVEEAFDLCCKLFLNLTLVYLQQKDPEKTKAAVTNCEYVLEMQPDNHKAMYLKAKALVLEPCPSITTRETALTLLEKCLAINPKNAQARSLFEDTKTELDKMPPPEMHWSYYVLVMCTVAFFIATGGFCPPVNRKLNNTLNVVGVGVMRADEF